MKTFFRNGAPDASRAEIERQFNAAFGIALHDAETRWHTYLETK